MLRLFAAHNLSITVCHAILDSSTHEDPIFYFSCSENKILSNLEDHCAFYDYLPGVGETLSLDHFSERDETSLLSRSRLRHFLSLSLSLESRNCSTLGLSLNLEVETSLMCYLLCTFLFPMHYLSPLLWSNYISTLFILSMAVLLTWRMCRFCRITLVHVSVSLSPGLVRSQHLNTISLTFQNFFPLCYSSLSEKSAWLKSSRLLFWSACFGNFVQELFEAFQGKFSPLLIPN